MSNKGNALDYKFSKNNFALEVIDAARRVTKQNITYREMPRREGDPAKLIGDASLAKSELHWTPQYKDLGDIIETAWQYMLKIN